MAKTEIRGMGGEFAESEMAERVMTETVTAGAAKNAADNKRLNRAYVRYWLYAVWGFLLALVFVGGVTRLTGSGLSITEWQPVHGIIPPLNQAEWQEEFAKYQQIAQYKEINPDMNLAGFQFIFWWEWVHRLLARFVFAGAVLLPLLYFAAAGRLEKRVKLGVLGIFLLGGLQGAVGWWMVHSGLGESSLTSVSQYRLAAHFITACFIIVAVFALARSLADRREKAAPRSIQYFAAGLAALLLLQIYWGALVAGLHAGRVYNSWPLMDGKVIPEGLFALSPLWRNFFENIVTVQFLHRFFAYALLTAAFVLVLQARKKCRGTAYVRGAWLLFALLMTQAVFGIVTLLLAVPIFWGLLHQIFALIVLSYAVSYWVAAAGAGNVSISAETVS